jgi:GTP-binding protein
MWLSEANVPFCIVFTKTDKAKKQSLGVDENVRSFLYDLDKGIGVKTSYFLTSAAKGAGAQALLQHIATLRQQFEAAKTDLKVGSPLLVPQED